MLKGQGKLRTAYGKPWADLLGEIQSNREFLKEIGRILVQQVVKEARADFERQGNRRTLRGEPEGIPNDEKFFQSFKWRLGGRNSVEVYSTWPHIKQIVEGRKKYRMKWLTRDRGVGIVPLEPEKGEVLFRWAPQSKEEAWIHPGFIKHNFVNRAFKKAKKEVSEEAKRRLLAALKGQKVGFR